MPITRDHGDGDRSRTRLRSLGLRSATALACTGVLAAPLVGIATAQTGSLGSAGPGSTTTPTSSTAPTSTPTSPPTTTPAPPTDAATVELRVLVLDDGDATIGALASRLEAEGVEVERIPAAAGDRAPITREMLADDDSTRAHYMGIVSRTIERNGLTAEENAVLDAFTADYGIREVITYDWPTARVGLGNPVGGVVDGRAVSLTPDALGGDWSYLDGDLQLDDLRPDVSESYGYVSTPAPAAGATFRPVLETDGGVLMGVHESGGRERLVSTVAMNRYQQHFKVLSHGIVSWLTRGVSTSLYRNTFNVQIDDVFLTDDEWDPEGNCTIGADCDPELYPPDAPGASSRMNASDVEFLRQWQDANGIRLDMTFNAFGALPGDPLTDALLGVKDELRWISHTWDHTNLGCTQDTTVTPWRCAEPRSWYPQEDIESQITRNLDWAGRNDVPLDPTELVTGEHSGLRALPQMPEDNPGLAPALAATGVEWIASDASREPTQRSIGQARTVPRHPMNIYYNTSTKANAVDEYNWIYTSEANGGSGLCTQPGSTCIDPLDAGTGFDSYIAPLEARHALGHALDMDPRPHYAHQSNLTNERILYPVLDRVVDDYRALFADSAPLIDPAHADLGREMTRRTVWASAAPQVTATVTGDRLTVTNSGTRAVEVPVTAPSGSDLAAGDADAGYSGARSSWVTVAAGDSVTIDLGTDVGFRTPDGTAAPAAAASRAVPRSTGTRAAQPGTVELPPLNEATRVGPIGTGHRAIG